MALGIPHRNKYSPDVRNFSIALNNISPAAFKFVRTEFNNNLPHSHTITAWYSNSDLNCEPGIIKHSLEILQRKVAEKAEKGEKLLGALLFDEISIRKHLQWVGDKMLGFENIPGKDSSKADIASESLVFMFSALNDNIRLPFAYYFVAKSLDASAKLVLLKENLHALFDCGVEIICITFDGLRVNPSMCELMGAIFDVYSDDFGPHFKFENKKIRIIFDFSHVEKLIRNTLSKKEVIYDAENNKIKWEYFERLVQFKDQRNFAFSHKLTQAHINWKTNPMNVKIAVQTFSASTANAMEFLMDQGHPEFVGAGPTIRFIRLINDLFDVCNSTDNLKTNPLKLPMSQRNANQIHDLFQDASAYIRGLQIIADNGKKVKLCSSINKTGFLGLCVNIQNLIDIYKEVVENKQLMENISTHSISQDHLEIFFGKVRSLNGYNNNPTCQQFNAAVRKLLANTTILYSKYGNCAIVDSNSTHYAVHNPYSNISMITSRRSTINSNNQCDDVSGDEIESLYMQLAQIQSLENGNNYTDLSDMTVAHIAGIIENRIFNSGRFDCEDCKTVLNDDPKICQPFLNSSGIRKPCRSTFKICTAADHFLKLEILKGQFNINVIHRGIISSLDYEEIFCAANFENHPEHKLYMMKHILSEYVRIKGVYLAKTYTFKEKQNSMRQKLSKLILQYNQ